MAKKSFILYKDQKEVVDELSDEQAGKLLKAIYEYNDNGKITLSGALKVIFIPFKNSFDRDGVKWEEISIKRSEAGKNHIGNQYTRNKANGTSVPKMEQNGTNGTVSVSVNDNVSVNDSVSVSVINNKDTHSNTHTLDEIISYAKELGIDDKEYCKKFFNNYESIGWVTNSGRQIKNWKTKFNQWIENDGILEKKEEKGKKYL